MYKLEVPDLSEKQYYAFLSKVPDDYLEDAKVAFDETSKIAYYRGARSVLDTLDTSTSSLDSVVETNRQLLLDRSNVGIAKYGTTLTENKGDLRYWLNHALEECLDQANYLQRAIMELDAKNGND